MADLYYIDSGYFTPADGYFAYIADGGSTISSQFTTDCLAEKFVGGVVVEGYPNPTSEFTLMVLAQRLLETSISLTSSFTQTVIGSRGRDIDLFAFTNAAIAVQVDRIRDNNLSATTAFNVAINFVVQRSILIDSNAIFATTTNAQRSRDTNIQIEAAFSFDLISNTTKLAAATISSECLISLLPNIIKQGEVTLSSEFTNSSIGNRIRYGIIATNSIFSIDTIARQIRDAHLTGTGVASIICNAVKDAQASSSQSSQFSQTALGGKVKSCQAALHSYASVFVSRNGFGDRPRNLTSGAVTYSTTTKKFGTHALATGTLTKTIVSTRPTLTENWFVEGWFGNNSFVDLGWIKFGIDVSAHPFCQVTMNDTIRYSYTYNTVGAGLIHVAISNEAIDQIAFYTNGTRRNFTSSPSWTGATSYQLTTSASIKGIVDEVLVTTDLLFNPGILNNTALVPTSARSDTANTKALWHLDNNGLDDYTVTAQTFTGDAALTAISSVSAAIGYLATYHVTLTSISSITAVVSKTSDINLVAFANANITANVSRFRGCSVQCDASSSISVISNRIQHSNAELNSIVTVVSTSDRVRSSNVNASSSFIISVAINIKTENIVNAVSNFTVSAVIGKLNEINLVAFANASVTTTAVKITNVIAPISGLFIQSVIAIKTVSVLTSLFAENNLIVDNSRSRNFSASLDVEGLTLTLVQATHIISAHLNSTFNTTAIVSKIVRSVAILESVSTLSASIRTDVFVALIATSETTVTATVVKTTDITINQASIFSILSDVNRIGNSVATLSSEFTIFCNAVLSSQIDIVAFSNASLIAVVIATKRASSTFTSTFTQFTETVDSVNSHGEAYIISTATLSCAPVKKTENIIDAISIASELSIVIKQTVTDIVCESNFTLITDVNKISRVNCDSNIVSSMSASPVRLLSGITHTDCAFTISINATKIARGVIATQAIASNLTAIIKIAGFFVNCNVVSTLSVSSIVIKLAHSTLTSIASITAIPTKIIHANSIISSNSSMSVIGNVRKQLSATFASTMTFVIEIRDLRLDEISYIIPGESWNYKIISESRIHSIYGETRIRSVTGETRERTITGESRIHIII